MQPLLLTARGHHQQIAISKFEVTALLGEAMAKLKRTGCPEGERCDRMGAIDLRLIICVPAHAVITMAIQIEQTAVKDSAAGSIDLLQQRLKPIGPAPTAMENSAVAIGDLLVCQEHRQPGHGMATSIHLNHRLLPEQLLL